MKIKYIGVDGAILDSSFSNYEELINAINCLNLESIETMIEPKLFYGGYYFNPISLGMNKYITILIKGVYEEGVIFQIVCKIDDATNKYNTATSGLLFVKKGEIPTFVISIIDNRIDDNKVLDGEESSFYKYVNQDIIKDLIKNMGKSVDTSDYIGKRKRENFFNRKKIEKKIELLSMKIKIILYQSLKQIQNIEKVKKKKL